eukprot:5493106-Prymnesium_polylepis.1
MPTHCRCDRWASRTSSFGPSRRGAATVGHSSARRAASGWASHEGASSLSRQPRMVGSSSSAEGSVAKESSSW